MPLPTTLIIHSHELHFNKNYNNNKQQLLNRLEKKCSYLDIMLEISIWGERKVIVQLTLQTWTHDIKNMEDEK